MKGLINIKHEQWAVLTDREHLLWLSGICRVRLVNGSNTVDFVSQ